MPQGLLQNQRIPPNPAAAHTGLLSPGGDPETVTQPGRLGLMDMLAQAPGAALNAAQLPQRVYEGQVDPTSVEGIQQTADLAGLVGGSGTLAPRPRNSLGIFGKFPKDVKTNVFMRDLGPNAGPGAPGSVVRQFKVGPHRVYSHYKVFKEPDNTVQLDLSFGVGGRDIDTGLPQHGMPEYVSDKMKFDILNTALSDTMQSVRKIRPSSVTFVAARDDLIRIYTAAARKFAKDNGGTYVPNEHPALFRIDFENARQFEPKAAPQTRIKGLLEDQS